MSALLHEARVFPEQADVEIRARTAQFVGACLASREVTFEAPELVMSRIESLHDAIQKAAEGNPEARRLVESNVRTDIMERTRKAGHVNREPLMVDEAGRIQQFGQSLESVQANSIRYAANTGQMFNRTRAEAANTFRTYYALQQGLLEDHSIVVLSRAADDMSDKDMAEAGFFVDTMSCSIQVTGYQDGQLCVDSAMVAGVRQKGQARHDQETIVKLGQKLGVDLTGKTAAEIIDMPLLVPNSMLSDGVIDLVKLYDECAGGTFFGQDKPPENYDTFRQTCQDREAFLSGKVQAITDELIGAAATITDRVHATKLLNKIAGKHMIQQAVFDTQIDPAVFGHISAIHIEQARQQWESGNYDDALTSIKQAERHDKSSSCPSGPMSSGGESGGSKEESGDCSFVSKTCPECGKKNVYTTVKRLGAKTKKITGGCGCVKFVNG